MKWLKQDGSLNTEAFDQLEADIRAVTDSNKAIDQVLKQARLGLEMVVVFQCGHSGLYFPSDYVKEWGRSYGIGQGPDPVSEVLDSDYHTAPPAITPEIQSFDQIMHPVGNCCAQMDLDLVAKEVFEANQAIAAKDDPRMKRRCEIVREKQLLNPKSRIRLLAMEWQRLNPRHLVERR